MPAGKPRGQSWGSAAHQRRGYASEAVLLLLRFMFGERRYHKCEVHIYAYNLASLALHRSLGFVDEGRLRDPEFFAGGHHDVVVMGMTAGVRRATPVRPALILPRLSSGERAAGAGLCETRGQRRQGAS
jgi:RimJ/RimL family protein N-acetyltransferase